MSDAQVQPGLPVVLGDGLPARALGLAAEVILLITERAFPPGQPLAFSLKLESETLPLEGKSAGSKRRDDGRFEVRVKLHSVRREQRERLRGLSWG